MRTSNFVIGFRCAALLIGKGYGGKYLDQSKQSFMTFDTHLNIADWLVRWTLDRKVWVQALTGSLCCVPELNTLIPKCLSLPPSPPLPLQKYKYPLHTLAELWRNLTPREPTIYSVITQRFYAQWASIPSSGGSGGNTFSYLMLQKKSHISHGLLGLKDLTFGIQL